MKHQSQNQIFVKTLLLSALLVCFTFAAKQPSHVPSPKWNSLSNWVANPDGIISSQTVHKLNKLSSNINSKHKIQIGIAAIDKMDSEYTIEEFTSKVFDLWGIGDKERNDGILYLLARDDRQHRIQTGRGIKHKLTDSICLHILHSVKPLLKNSNYDQAALHVIQDIHSFLDGNLQIADTSSSSSSWSIWIYIIIFIIAIIIVNAIDSYRKKKAFEAKLKKLQTMMTNKKINLAGEETCGICLEDISEADAKKDRLSQLPCNHLYHSDCISKWLEKDANKSCPLCRRPVIEDTTDQNKNKSASTQRYTHSSSQQESSRNLDETFVVQNILNILQFTDRELYTRYNIQRDFTYTPIIDPVDTESASDYGGGDSSSGGGASDSW